MAVGSRGGRRHVGALRALAAGAAAFSVLALGISWVATRATVAPSSSPAATSSGPPAAIVGMAATPDGGGYWLVGPDGGVLSFGEARFFGSTGDTKLRSPVVGVVSAPDGGGYWLAARDGGVFAFGGARFFGSMGATALNQPIVAMAATPDGGGYWLVASDGGVFAFGDAPYVGSMGSVRLNQPVVGMAATLSGQGYWLVATDGGVFAFGDAAFRGSTGSVALNRPVVAMAASADGSGYWLAAEDGGIFAFGVTYGGSAGGEALDSPVVDVVGAPGGRGYWMSTAGGGVYGFGAAGFHGSLSPRVAFFGDSLAGTLTHDLTRARPPAGVAVGDEGIFGCGLPQGGPIVVNGRQSADLPQPCDGSSSPQWPELYQQLVSRDSPQVAVLVVGFWEVVDRWHDGAWTNITDPAYQRYLTSQLVRAINILHAQGAHVDLTLSPYFNEPNPGNAVPAPEESNARVDKWNQIVRQMPSMFGAGVSILDFNAKLDPNGIYSQVIDGIVVRAPDGVHFPYFNVASPYAADPDTEASCAAFGQWFGDWLWPQLLEP